MARGVTGQLRDAGVTNVDYRMIPLDHPEAEGERPGYDPPPRYVSQLDTVPDAGLDFAIVDGHYRTACVRACAPKPRPGGHLLVGDVNLWPDLAALPVPAGWTLADDSTNGVKRSCVGRAA